MPIKFIRLSGILFFTLSLFFACQGKQEPVKGRATGIQKPGYTIKALLKEQEKVSITKTELQFKDPPEKKEINTAPSFRSAKLSLTVENDRPILKVDSVVYDKDGDEVVIEYRWYKNGELVSEESFLDDFKRGDRITVKIRAFDGKDYSPEKYLSLEVLNTPPRIIDDGRFTFDGKNFEKVLGAEDPDGDEVRFTLLKGPEGMTLDEKSGVIKWTVPEDFQGDVPVEVEVDDGHGGKTKYGFNIKLMIVLEEQKKTL